MVDLSIFFHSYVSLPEGTGKPGKTRENHSVTLLSLPSDHKLSQFFLPLSFSIFSMAQENTLDWMVKTSQNH